MIRLSGQADLSHVSFHVSPRVMLESGDMIPHLYQKEVRERYHDFIHQLLKGKKDWGGEETILHLSRHASEEYIEYCNNYIEQDIKVHVFAVRTGAVNSTG